MSVTGRRLLVVEDEPLMASLLSEVLVAQGFVVQTAANTLQARSAVDAFDPDAALLDISLGDGPSGLDLAHVLDRKYPHIALLFLTKHSDARTAGLTDQDLPVGCGFLRKDRVRDTGYLLESLESVLAERPDRVRDDQDPTKPLAPLNAQQLEVLRLMAQGYTNDYIARVKGASLSSVERWVMQVFRSLDIDTRGDLNPRVEAVRRFVAAASLPERP
ncbi:MAG: response regulator [Actinomycetales bacterium]